MRERTRAREDRRRGAAMVLVLIFGTGALMLVATMLSLSTLSVRAEAQRHDEKVLAAVVRQGVAMSVNEINRRRLEPGYVDPTGCGFGGILVGPDGQEGWPVRASGGRLLGRFRSMIRTEVRTDGARHILSVVAVWPSFADPRLMAAGEVELRRGTPPFDRNALSVRGDADAGGAPGVYGTSNQVDIVDLSYSVPAVNISDESSYQAFLSNVSQFGSVSGYGGADGATTTSVDSGLLDQTTLQQIAAGIDARVTGVRATGTRVDSTMIASGAPLTGEFYIDASTLIDSSQTLTGSGTLVIAADVDVLGSIDWDGDVIVANASGARLDVGGRVDVTGVLSVQGIGGATNMGVSVGNGGRIAVDGAFPLLGDDTSDALLQYASGARILVDGIMTVMGNDLAMEFSTGGELYVSGSLALVTPAGSETGVDIRFRNGTHMDLAYDAGQFDEGLNALGAFFDPNGVLLPVSVPGYWERAPLLVKQAQDTALAGDPARAGSYGL